MALAIWKPLCVYIFLIYIMGTSIAILRALGMQWRAAAIISAALYLCTLPLVLYFAFWQRGGLVAQWKILPFCYFFMQIALACGYSCMDWEGHAVKIRLQLQRNSDDHSGPLLLPTEVTALL